MRNAVVSSALKIIANVVVVLALLLQISILLRRFHSAGSISALGLAIANIVMVTMYIARSDAKSISKSPGLWLLAFAGTCLPLALRPLRAEGLTALGTGVQLVGMVAMIVSLLSLRRSFGIVPAHRGIRTGGLYQLIRHPLYASELLIMAGVVLCDPSTLNLSLFACACVLQFLRAMAEEKFLGGDPLYSEYKARVKYRLIPGVL